MTLARAAAAGATALALAPLVSEPAQARRSPKKAIWGPAYSHGVSYFPRYRDLGVTLYEDALPWDQIAPTRPRRPRDPADPAYRWPADVTRAVGEAGQYRMRVGLSLVGSPRWANGGHAWNWAPLRTRDYADFAYAASRRYPSVRLWMIWTEPSRRHTFNPLTPAPPGAALTPAQARAPRRYARMLDAAYGALKAADAGDLVVGGMSFSTGDIDPWQWVANLRLPGGGRPRLDLYGHNPFSGREPDFRAAPSCCGLADFSDLPRFRRAVNRALGRPGRRSIPIFLSEYNIPTAVNSEFNYHVDPATQARWIRSAWRLVRGTPWIYGLGWIVIRDDRPRRDGALVRRTGLLDADGRPKPGYFAFRAG